MVHFGALYVLAFEPSSVAGAAVSTGLGASKLRTLLRVPLSSEALVPSPFEPNIARPEEVREAVARVAAALGVSTTPACVVLPDGLARIVLLDVPSDVAPEPFARFKLLGSLPYPPQEAVVDVLAVGGGRVLAAAVRRSVVQSYEAVMEAAGVAVDRVDLAPLAALAALGRESPGPGTAVDLVLGEAALSLAVRRGGQLALFRNRRRDAGAGEEERLALEVERAHALAGNGGAPRIRVLGAGAAGLVRRWKGQGREAEPGWSLAAPDPSFDTAELPWMGAVMA